MKLAAFENKPMGVFPWVGQFLLPYRLQVAAALLFLMIGALAWLALGQGVRLLVDEGMVQGDPSRLQHTVILILVISVVSSAAVYARFYLMSWLGERVSADVRTAVYQHMLKLAPAFYSQTRTGEVISRFTADTLVIQTVIGSSFSMALRSMVTAFGGLAMMAVTSWKLTALVIVAVPIVLLPMLILAKRVRQMARASQDRLADIGAHVDESIHEIHTVQSYGHEQADHQRFTSKIEAVMAAAKERMRYRALLIASVMLLSIMAITLVGWIGALDVLSGAISAGQLTAFLFYAVLVAGGAATISEVIGDIQRAAGASERLMELMHTPIEIESPAQPAPFPKPVRGELRFEQVNFSYPQVPTQPVLRDLDLVIAPGERIALVGPSGAGKSTVFQLLQRFYPLSSGQILLDGVAIDRCDPAQLRQQFALVPQDAVIFATSVLENVRYGRPTATLEDVIAACQAAEADSFIRLMPEGYQSQLGERGVRLSGGQKQRIAIARAILADRPILLLDEATSALDASSEQAVKVALDHLMQNKTTLIIAHRLSTVLHADRILVLDKGELIAIGKHDALIASCPLYREYAQLQLLAE